MTFLRRMVAITEGNRRTLGVAVAGSVLFTALAVIPALLLREIVKALVAGSATPALVLELGALTLAVTALMGGMRYLEGAFGHLGAFRVLHRVRLRAYEHLQRLSMGYHTRQQSGILAARLIGDVEAIEGFTAHAMIGLIVAVTIPVLLGIVMLLINWKLALVALAPLPVILILVFAFRDAVARGFAVYRDLLGRLNGKMVDHIQGVGVLTAFAAQRDAHREVTAMSGDLQQAAIRVNLLHTAFFAAVEGMAAIPTALVIAIGGLLAVNRLVSVSDLVAFLFLTTQLYRPITELNRQIEQYRNAQAAADRVFAVLEAPIEVRDRPGASEPARPAFDVVLDQVTFAYEPGRPVLHDVSITLEGNAVLALVGPSGAGKTTIANLIARFWDPQEGSIRLGGVDLRDLPLDYVHRSIALVLQDVFLFNDTVAANIRVANPQAGQAEIERAARAASAHDFVMDLPNGYDTILGERGVRLSGGQKQRISIARALLRDAPILILDEATSSVDPEAEHLIQSALARLVAERTVLVIAHRLSTIRQAQEIVVLDHGRVVQRGRHDDLVERPGLYATLYRAQQLARRWDVTSGAERGGEAEGTA
ncbi:MAG TPA: ABC transporter ATP-binding protein [Candidatus Limnocylindrales bacterium]|nr:ABC transporter ATP-binding protein [Candidatus Limnocylindrales bacterium]